MMYSKYITMSLRCLCSSDNFACENMNIFAPGSWEESRTV